ncbi:MAG: CvpA family protein [Treponema sp.]|nr:CvpA family protein [Treponema sp.]
MFNVIDIFFALLILTIGIFAAIKGFIKEIFSKASFVIAILASFVFYNVLGSLLEVTIKNKIASQIIAFFSIFIVVFLVIKLVQYLLEKIFSGEIVSGLDHSLGFFLGLAEGFAVVFLILLLLTKQPWFDVQKLLENSYLYKLFKVLLPEVPSNIQIPDTIIPESSGDDNSINTAFNSIKEFSCFLVNYLV